MYILTLGVNVVPSRLSKRYRGVVQTTAEVNKTTADLVQIRSAVVFVMPFYFFTKQIEGIFVNL